MTVANALLRITFWHELQAKRKLIFSFATDNFDCRICSPLCWVSILPVVVWRPLPSDRGENVNVNSRRLFCNFSTLKRLRMPLDVASLRYARNFQLVVIEMLNCRSRHHFRCDLAPPNGCKKSTCTKWLATRWASLHGQQIVLLFQPVCACTQCI